MSQFITGTQSINELLGQVTSGRLGLPEFQRRFRWDRDRVRGLLVSILNDYPVGSLLFYCPGNPRLFGRRPLEGAPALKDTPDVSLALDGQQRLTSLVQALQGKGDVRYYLDVAALLASADTEDQITYAVPQYRKVFRKEEWYVHHHLLLRPTGGYEVFHADKDEQTRKLLPLKLLAQEFEWMPWLMTAGFTTTEISVIASARQRLLHGYKFPVVTLTADVTPDRVCFIFEKINSSGLQLSLFELLNAKLYRAPAPGEAGMNLAHMWTEAKVRHPRFVRFGVWELMVLQTLALFSTRDKTPGCRRKEIFELTVEDVRDLWPRAIAAVDAVLQLLEERAGIRNSTWFPFPTMTPALAVIYDSFREALHGRPTEAAAVERLLRYYRCAVFANRFGSAVETKLAEDTRAVTAWIASGDSKIPLWIKQFEFNVQTLRQVTTTSSAVYQGVFCLVLRTANDLHSGSPLTADWIAKYKVDDHHIFPKKTLVGVASTKDCNCVLNRTLIGSSTNKSIRDKRPSLYLPGWRKAGANVDVDAVLDSLAIPSRAESPEIEAPGGYAETFSTFLRRRERLLGQLIAAATGGKVHGYTSDADVTEDEDTAGVIAGEAEDEGPDETSGALEEGDAADAAE